MINLNLIVFCFAKDTHGKRIPFIRLLFVQLFHACVWHMKSKKKKKKSSNDKWIFIILFAKLKRMKFQNVFHVRDLNH